MYTSSDYTVLSACLLYQLYTNIQIYPVISFWFVNIYQSEVPKYGVCLPCGPIDMDKF